MQLQYLGGGEKIEGNYADFTGLHIYIMTQWVKLSLKCDRPLTSTIRSFRSITPIIDPPPPFVPLCFLFVPFIHKVYYYTILSPTGVRCQPMQVIFGSIHPPGQILPSRFMHSASLQVTVIRYGHRLFPSHIWISYEWRRRMLKLKHQKSQLQNFNLLNVLLLQDHEIFFIFSYVYQKKLQLSSLPRKGTFGKVL